MSALTARGKLFILAESTAAVLISAFALAHSESSGLGTFLLLLGLSAATGAMKVVLPGVPGNLSASYFFLMWGIVRMSLGETLLMGWAASLVQSYWQCKKKPAPVQLLFNLSVISLSIGAGSLTFNAAVMRAIVPNELVRMPFAALTYFAVNTLSVSGIIGLTEGLSVGRVWRSTYLWSFPYYLLSASVIVLIEYLKNVFGMGAALLVLPPAYLVYHTFAMHITSLNQALERAEQEKRHSEETAALHLRTIRALALAIEAKDQTTAEHLHRVQTYAMGLAADFGLPPEEMEALRAAAVLHDVGKIAVPEHIIAKPGKLTPGEFAQMKIHTVVGAEIVTSADFPFSVAPLVRAHHEKWDGSGYPDGLKGEEIPFGARILTAVDCLDALASDRQYRKAIPLEKAMSIVAAESGKSFDPRVVEALKRRYHELESLAKSTLPTTMKGFSIDARVDLGAAPDAGYAAGSHTDDPASALTHGEAAREASLLNFVSSQIGQFESIEADLLAVEKQLRELIPHDAAALFRRRNHQLECTFAEGNAAPLLRGLIIETGVGASGWTMANRTPLLNGNAVTEFGAGGVPPDFGLTSSLSIPLESEFGPVGVLTFYSGQQNAFRTDHLRALLALRSTLAYQMSLDSSGSLRRTRRTALCADAENRPQLERLSEAVQASGASSPARRTLLF